MKVFVSKFILYVMALFIVLEVFFRFVVPANVDPYAYMDENELILKYATEPSTGVHTSGRFAEVRSRWFINNAGFYSKNEFVPADKQDKPLVALIGNSYVQQIYLNWEDHLASILETKLSNQYTCYPIGVAGGNLSESLLLARYARENYDPDVYVFLLTENILELSWTKFRKSAHILQYDYNDGQFQAKGPQLYKVNERKRMFRMSATARYLMLNAHLQPGTKGNNKQAKYEESFAENENNLEVLAELADFLVQDIKEEFGDKRLIFVSDSNRRRLYQTGEVSLTPANELIKNACEKYNVEFVDLSQTFADVYKKKFKSFNYSFDYHWNKYAVNIVADKIVDALNK